MEEITVFKISDGTLIEDYDKALLYCENKMGEELDELLKPLDIGLRTKISLMTQIQKSSKLLNLINKWNLEYTSIKES